MKPPISSSETMDSSAEEDDTRRRDEIDELFNYDAGVNDPFSDNYQPAPLPERREKTVQTSIHPSNDLGIDDEITLTRKRRVPRVKLDENLLISPAGIPKLQSKAKSLKFKGKGYEVFCPTAKLYQPKLTLLVF